MFPGSPALPRSAAAGYRDAIVENTSSISLALYGIVVVVEMIGRQPSSAILKALALAVLLGVAVVPLGGGVVTLLAVRQDLARSDRAIQALVAAILAVACVVAGMAWLVWLADPHGNPPGVPVG